MSTAPSLSKPGRGYMFALQMRFDSWRDFNVTAQTWASQTDRSRPTTKDQVLAAFEGLKVIEEYQAYPGRQLMKALSDRIAADDATGTARLARQISSALLSRSYRENPADWESDELATGAEASTARSKWNGAHKPYFEVLIVSPATAARAATADA